MLPSQHRHLNGMQSEIIDGIKLMTTSRRETFTFRAGTVTPKLFAWVYDHKSLAKDKLLGEGEIEVRFLIYIRSRLFNCKSRDRFGGTYDQIQRRLPRQP